MRIEAPQSQGSSSKTESLKILLVLRSIVDFRYLGDVVQDMADHGHRIKIVVEQAGKRNTTDRALRACADANELVQLKIMPDRERSRLRMWARHLVNYGHYYRPGHPSPQMAKRWRSHLPAPMRLLLYVPPLRKVLVSNWARQALHHYQANLPPDEDAVQELAEFEPNVVIVSPFLKRSVLDIEFVKAGLQRGIPTVFAISSWDNLTGRGTYHVMPDYTFVWNHALKEEAVEIHDVPAEKIFVTGSPTFDFWFDMQPTMSREKFCGIAGIPSEKPYIAYLCSTASIAKNESEYVAEFAQIMRAQADTQHIHILVRPHPLHAAQWANFSAENVSIWPLSGEWPDVPETKQEYFHTLIYSEAVFGVNTSGFLDAAVLGKPAVTAITDRYRQSQTGRGHFAHLLKADFLEVRDSLPEAASVLAAIVSGRDAKAENLRRFVREFIRPYGLHRRPGEIFARAIEMVAQGKSALDIDVALMQEVQQQEQQKVTPSCSDDFTQQAA